MLAGLNEGSPDSPAGNLTVLRGRERENQKLSEKLSFVIWLEWMKSSTAIVTSDEMSISVKRFYRQCWFSGASVLQFYKKKKSIYHPTFGMTNILWHKKHFRTVTDPSVWQKALALLHNCTKINNEAVNTCLGPLCALFLLGCRYNNASHSTLY